MKLRSLSPYKIIASLNILIIICIYTDYYFPLQSKIIEKFDRFETDAVITRSRRSSSYAINNYVDCINGNSYFLTRKPGFESEFKKGDNFILIETYFFKKIKRISIKKDNSFYSEDISFLNYTINKSLYLLALIISAAYLIYEKDFLNFFLAFATVFSFVITFFYLF